MMMILIAPAIVNKGTIKKKETISVLVGNWIMGELLDPSVNILLLQQSKIIMNDKFFFKISSYDT